VTREEFDALIVRYERISRERPRLYLARIVGLVILAYGYLLLVLLGTLALSLLMIAMVIAAPATIKLALLGLVVFGGLFLAVLRGLRVRLDPPTGRPVTREQAPRLFALLDELRAALDCQPFHHVLLVNDLNAAVVQIPRLGIFGWHRNYLVLGLPLLTSLSPEEFRAVLAHEFAHSSRGHGRFGNWLYRVRQTWAQVIGQMVRQRTRWSWVLTKFLDWFWPKFSGHTFVLARANEYVADAGAVRLAGAENIGRALVRLRVDAALLGEKFWPEIFARANDSELPPADVMAELQQALQRGPNETDGARWLRQAFLLETSNADTHPSLKDRLRAIGWPATELDTPALPPPFRTSAAEHFLGSETSAVARQLSQEWHDAIRAQWQERHAQARKLAEELAASTPADAPPGAKQLWEKALKLVNLHGDDAALPVLQQVLALEPQHAGANFILGRLHLKTDDAQGIGLIENALRADPFLTEDGCGLLYAHFNRTGQRDRLRPLEHRVDQFREATALAQQERNQITAKDTFLSPELAPDQLAILKTILATEKDIASAAVARKQVQHFPQKPYRTLALKLDVPWWKLRRRSSNQKLVGRLVAQLKLADPYLVFVGESNLKALGQKVYAVPGSIIYVKGR
jgi:Zn-dependent protease with chaperone function